MPLKHTLLGLLDKEAMHGYELRKRAGEFSWIYPMTNAAIYPALHALENDKLIRHESQVHNGRARKIYHITDEGRASLRSWLDGDVKHTLSLRDQMLLRIVLHGKQDSPLSLSWISTSLESLEVEMKAFEAAAASREQKTQGMEVVEEFGLEVLKLRVRLFQKLLDLPRAEVGQQDESYIDGRNTFATA